MPAALIGIIIALLCLVVLLTAFLIWNRKEESKSIEGRVQPPAKPDRPNPEGNSIQIDTSEELVANGSNTTLASTEPAFKVSSDLELLLGEPQIPVAKKTALPKPTSEYIKEPTVQLRCCKQGMMWKLCVSVSEGFIVSQNDQTLEPLSGYYSTFLLDSLSEPVSIADDTEHVFTHTFSNESGQPIIFKVLESNDSEGRLVRTIGKGRYIVLAPESWEREESLSGSPLISASSTNLSNYRAHFFLLDERSRDIAFYTPDGKIVKISAQETLFELMGHFVSDGFVDVPLYGKEFPRITEAKQGVWQSVKRIDLERIENGSAIESCSIVPTDDSVQVFKDFNAHSGLYRVRILGKNADTLSILNFRYCSSLSAIDVLSSGNVSEEDGSGGSINIAILHEPSTIIQPKVDAHLQDFAVNNATDSRTTLNLAPSAEISQVEVGIGDSPDNLVPIYVLLETIWWCIESDQEQENTDWSTAPLKLSREHFQPSSKVNIRLRFPKTRWVDQIKVGFDSAEPMKFKIRVDESQLKIPLHSFSNYQCVDAVGDYCLRVWYDRLEREHEITLADVSINAYCKQCSFCCSSVDELINHLSREHVDQLFEQTKDSDAAEYLPDALYRCNRCGINLVLSMFESPALIAQRHIDFSCPQKAKNTGAVELIKSRTDLADEFAPIRACKVCGIEISTNDAEVLASHFFSQHEFDSYSVYKD